LPSPIVSKFPNRDHVFYVIVPSTWMGFKEEMILKTIFKDGRIWIGKEKKEAYSSYGSLKCKDAEDEVS